ncbi:MAG: hypothetical protein LBT08_02780 [Synergistaceae bacterium]|jgi:hypothetical protein|nr:hypothetical protein [Synergistaceae bacterium]
MRGTAGICKFTLFDGAAPPRVPFSGGRVLLYPFRSVSVQGFSYPFSGISRVREVLKIKFRPLLGDSSDRVAIIPFFVNSERKSSSGCVFLLFGDENDEIEAAISGDDGCHVWPAALAFAAEIDGNGIILWTDDECITTVWLDNWVPKLYKTVDASSSSEEEEERAAIEYVASQGGSAEKIFLLKKSETLDSDVQTYGARTLSRCPAYEQLDLSNRGANLLERREHAVRSLFRTTKLSIAFGAILLLLSGGIYALNSSVEGSAGEEIRSIYSSSFGESSPQPVTSAMEKLRTVGVTVVDTSLYATLRSVSAAWEKLEVSSDVYIETMRYGSENTDITGTARSNESIQRLRQLLEAEGLSAPAGGLSIGTIPGGDFRFNMNITRGGVR